MTRATKLDPKGTAKQAGNYYVMMTNKSKNHSDSFDQSSTLENTNGGFNTTQETSTFDFDGDFEGVSDFQDL